MVWTEFGTKSVSDTRGWFAKQHLVDIYGADTVGQLQNAADAYHLYLDHVFDRWDFGQNL